VLEDEYLPLLKKTDPGSSDETALQDELKNKQGVLLRSRLGWGRRSLNGERG